MQYVIVAFPSRIYLLVLNALFLFVASIICTARNRRYISENNSLQVNYKLPEVTARSFYNNEQNNFSIHPTSGIIFDLYKVVCRYVLRLTD